MAKETTRDLISRVDECLRGKGGVLDRLDKYNSSATTALKKLEETNLKIAKAESIAQLAQEKASKAQESSDTNSKNFNRFLVAFLICLLTILFSIGIPTWTG